MTTLYKLSVASCTFESMAFSTTSWRAATTDSTPSYCSSPTATVQHIASRQLESLMTRAAKGKQFYRISHFPCKGNTNLWLTNCCAARHFCRLLKGSTKCQSIWTMQRPDGCLQDHITIFYCGLVKETVDNLGHPVNYVSLSNDNNCLLVNCLDSTVRLLDKRMQSHSSFSFGSKDDMVISEGKWAIWTGEEIPHLESSHYGSCANLLKPALIHSLPVLDASNDVRRRSAKPVKCPRSLGAASPGRLVSCHI